jgi:hypothetical protein
MMRYGKAMQAILDQTAKRWPEIRGIDARSLAIRSYEQHRDVALCGMSLRDAAVNDMMQAIGEKAS